MATIARKGYGQVEPNHLSGIVTGQIYAQLPAATETSAGLAAITQLEQGQFFFFFYAAGCADFTGDGEWMLVYCEEKLENSDRQLVHNIDGLRDRVWIRHLVIQA